MSKNKSVGDNTSAAGGKCKDSTSVECVTIEGKQNLTYYYINRCIEGYLQNNKDLFTPNERANFDANKYVTPHEQYYPFEHYKLNLFFFILTRTVLKNKTKIYSAIFRKTSSLKDTSLLDESSASPSLEEVRTSVASPSLEEVRTSVVSSSNNLTLDCLEIDFTNYMSINYDNYNKLNKFSILTISIIAFKKNLLYYLIYIASILCKKPKKEDEREVSEKIVILLCSDHNTCDGFLTNLSDLNTAASAATNKNISLYSGHGIINPLDNEGPLIQLLNKLPTTDILNYNNFIYSLFLFLEERDVNINLLSISSQLGSTVGMKRAMINQFHCNIAYKLEDTDFYSSIIDDNISDIIKPILGIIEGKNLIHPSYVHENDEIFIPCSVKISDPLSQEKKTEFVQRFPATIPDEDLPSNSVKWVDLNGESNIVSTDSISIDHKLLGSESDSSIEEGDGKMYPLLKTTLTVDNKEIPVYNDIIIDKPVNAKDKLCTAKSNALIGVDSEIYGERYTKCKTRKSILEILKKINKKMIYENSKIPNRYLVGGIPKGKMGRDDIESTYCGNKITALYKLTVQVVWKLQDFGICYNPIATYNEDMHFNGIASRHISQAETAFSTLLKINQVIMRFAHVKIDDNEVLYPDNFNQNFVNPNITGLTDSTIFSAFCINKLKQIYSEKNVSKFGYNKKAAGKYQKFHHQSWYLDHWLDDKQYIDITYPDRTYWTMDTTTNYPDLVISKKDRINFRIGLKTEFVRHSDSIYFRSPDINYNWISEIDGDPKILEASLLPDDKFLGLYPVIETEYIQERQKKNGMKKYIKYLNKYLKLKNKI